MKRINHGLSQTPTYRTWANMKSRCSNKKSSQYEWYGKRGIKVCKRWYKFLNFYEDMGDRPNNKTIDRINNDGDYKPSNCRWANLKEQNLNRRSNVYLTYKNKTQTISEWAKECGINRKCLQLRISRYNWSIKKALTTKIGLYTKQ